MSEWLVKLKGPEEFLNELVKVSVVDWSIVRIANAFYLKSEKLNAHEHPSDVDRAGAELLEVINGAASLHFEGFEPASVHGPVRLHDDGRLEPILLIHGTQVVTRFGRHSVGPPQSSPHEDIGLWVGLSDESDDIREALTLYGKLAHTWRNLYIMLGVVERDCGSLHELVKRKWAPKSKMRLFRRTANSNKVLGADARHGRDKEPPPTDPMSLDEAQDLVNRVLQAWLNSRSTSRSRTSSGNSEAQADPSEESQQA